MDSYFQFLDWFYSSWLATALFGYKIFAGLVSILLFGAIVYITILSSRLKKPLAALEEELKEDFGKIPDSVKSDVPERWEKVLAKFRSVNPSDWKMAVIEADALTDDLLKRMGYKGETMGDRLKQLDSSKLSSLDLLWEAHKIRNLIAHDPEYRLSRKEIDTALDGYEKSLDEMDLF